MSDSYLHEASASRAAWPEGLQHNPFIIDNDPEGTLGAVTDALRLLKERMPDGMLAELCIVEGCEEALRQLEWVVAAGARKERAW